jgi:hypothetical protein
MYRRLCVTNRYEPLRKSVTRYEPLVKIMRNPPDYGK